MKRIIGIVVLVAAGVVGWDIFEDGKLDMPDKLGRMGLLPGYAVGTGVATGVGDSLKGMAGKFGGN